MEEREIPKREEKLWSEIQCYRVATNNARCIGKLFELIINDKTGRIVDIVVKLTGDRNIHIRGAKLRDDLLFIPFAKVEKIGEFIIVTE